jgi:hypothetical protein
MSKLFKVAGVSRRNGTFKARFANDMTRVKVLAKTGSSDIDLIELKEPMTKEDAVAFLISIDFDNGNAEIRAALEAEVEKRSAPKAANKERKGNKETKKPKKAPTPKPSLDAIKARGEATKKAATKAQIEAQLADLEDAPY